MKAQLLIFSFALNFHCLNAQQGVWSYFVGDGPASCLAAQGNVILVGTFDAGLLQFDTLGNRTDFTTFNSDIPDLAVYQVGIDEAGDWWIQINDGIARYNGGNWEIWDMETIGLPAFTRTNVIRAAPGGGIYVGTDDSGVAIYENGTWSVLNSSNSGLTLSNVKDIAFGPDGKIYYAGLGGLAVQDGNNWTLHTSTSTGLSLFNNTKSVALTSTGTVWAAAGDFRFAKLEGGVWTSVSLTDIGLTAAIGRSGRVFVDEYDRVWLTFSRSVSVLDNGNWTHYLDTDIGCSLSPTLIHTASPVLDGADQLWVPSCNLARLDGTTWTRPATGNSNLNLNIFDITQDETGRMWFGDGKGLAIRDTDGNWSRYNPLDVGASNDEVTDLMTASDGAVWTGFFGGELLRYNGANWTLFDTCAVTFPGFYVRTSAQAPNGDLWFSLAPSSAYSARLAQYSNGEWHFYTPFNTPLPATSDIEKIVFEADGTGWFASSFTGLWRFDGVDWTVLTTANSGLPSNNMRDVTIAPDGALWVCTDLGLASYDGVDWTVLNTTNSGLPANRTARIAFDGAGGMYVGYSSLDAGARCTVLRDGVWTTLTPPGFEEISPNSPYAFFIDRNDRLWFSMLQSINVVFMYDPMIVGTAEHALPEVHLSAFPNPTNGLLNLQWSSPTLAETLFRVSNLQGQTVYTTTLQKREERTELDLQHLPAGVYAVTAIQGGGVATVKVVKQ